MRDYAEFYCKQDVNVLRLGFNEFRNGLLKISIVIIMILFPFLPSLIKYSISVFITLTKTFIN